MTLAGFPISVHGSWYIVLALLTWILARTYFPEIAPGTSAVLCTLAALLAALALFACLLLHELAHSVVARRLGIPVSGITLFALGGVSRLTREPSRPLDDLMMAGAGPLTSFALGAVLALAWIGAGMMGWPVIVREVLAFLWMTNIVLAAFNLLPAFPLDGGRILRSMVWLCTGDHIGATTAAAIVGTLFGIMFFGLGLMRMVTSGSFLAGLMPMLVGMFVRQAAWSQLRMVRAAARLDGVPVGDFTVTPLVAAPCDMDLGTFVRDCVHRHRLSFYPVVDEAGRLLGIIDAHAPRRVPLPEWSLRQVCDVMEPLLPGMVLDPDTDASRILQILQQSGERRIVVARAEEPLGILDLGALLKYLRQR
jgi:Zn-dependent protease/CBS domain-containing protein